MRWKLIKMFTGHWINSAHREIKFCWAILTCICNHFFLDLVYAPFVDRIKGLFKKKSSEVTYSFLLDKGSDMCDINPRVLPYVVNIQRVVCRDYSRQNILYKQIGNGIFVHDNYAITLGSTICGNDLENILVSKFD